MPDKLEITRDIAASPEAVYAAISDVTRMGEWSTECHTCEWQEGFDGPTVGSILDGHNRNGKHECTRQGKVIEADPGRTFTSECSMMAFPFMTLAYRYEPTADDCRVTDRTQYHRTHSA